MISGICGTTAFPRACIRSTRSGIPSSPLPRTGEPAPSSPGKAGAALRASPSHGLIARASSPIVPACSRRGKSCAVCVGMIGQHLRPLRLALLPPADVKRLTPCAVGVGNDPDTISPMWSAPTARAGMLCHSASYPSAAKSPRTRPSRIRRSNSATFSTMTKRGRSSPIRRAYSRHRPLRASCSPERSPASDMSWQGNPPQMQSTEIPSARRIDLAERDSLEPARALKAKVEAANACEQREDPR
jgi:hypothetical protein